MPTIDAAWAVAVLMLWARLGVLWTLSPLAQTVKAPPAFWVLFTLALSSSLCLALGLRAAVPTGLGGLALMLVSEVTLGALLGLSLHAAFATLAMAGRLLDVQMGFGLATMLDPVTRAKRVMHGEGSTLNIKAAQRAKVPAKVAAWYCLSMGGFGVRIWVARLADHGLQFPERVIDQCCVARVLLNCTARALHQVAESSVQLQSTAELIQQHRLDEQTQCFRTARFSTLLGSKGAQPGWQPVNRGGRQ
jgi:hypothetical protein